jgi:hypothetical protein
VEATIELRYVSTNVDADVSVTDSYSFLLFNETPPGVGSEPTITLYQEAGLNKFYLHVAPRAFGYLEPIVGPNRGVLSPSATITFASGSVPSAFNLSSTEDQFLTVSVANADSGISAIADGEIAYQYSFYLDGSLTEVANPVLIDLPTSISRVVSDPITVPSKVGAGLGSYSGLTATVDTIYLPGSGLVWRNSLETITYSGVRDSGIIKIGNGTTDAEGATFKVYSDGVNSELVITLSGAIAVGSLPTIVVSPAAYFQTSSVTANSGVSIGQGFASLRTAAVAAAQKFNTSGLDNTLYIKITGAIFPAVINSGIINYSAGDTDNASYVNNSGTYVRLSDTEVLIIPGSGLELTSASAEEFTLSGLIRTAEAVPNIAANVSSFRDPDGFSSTVNPQIEADDRRLTVTLSNLNLVFSPSISQADITFSGLNKAVFEAANIIFVSDTEINITGFGNLIAAADKYEIIFKPSAFNRGAVAFAGTAPTITITEQTS